jgi:hypothetical protein
MKARTETRVHEDSRVEPIEKRDIIQLHTFVRFGPERVLRGQIIAICLRDTGTTYEVVWWDGATRHTAWLASAEISVEDVAAVTTLGAYL